MIKKLSFVIAVVSGFDLLSAEHSGVLFNLIVKNTTTTPLVIRTVTGAEVHVDPQSPTKSNQTSQSSLIKWVLHKGARKGLKIEANKNTLLFVSLGRGSFNLNEETYARLIDYNDPDYNIFVRTNTPENTILSSWRLKEPVQSENNVPEIDLTLEFYKDDQLPQLRVRQNIKAENLRIIKDKIKTNVEPIKDIFFK